MDGSGTWRRSERTISCPTYADRAANSPSPSSEAWLFAQALLGIPVPQQTRQLADELAEQELLQWVADISSTPQRCHLSPAAHKLADQELRQWVAEISSDSERWRLNSASHEPAYDADAQREFKQAGITLEDAANKLRIPGHYGPHAEAYHQEIFRRLKNATQGKRANAYKEALLNELQKIAGEARTPRTKLNRLLTEEFPQGTADVSDFQ